MATGDSDRRVWIGRETTEGTTAKYFRMIPCASFKPNDVDNRITPREYAGNLVTQLATVRATKHGELDMTFYARLDHLGWLLCSAIGAPTSTLTGSGTNNVQTLNFTGTWANADTFTLTIDGHTTGNIAYNTVGATIQSSIVTALNTSNMPSTVSASTAGTGNVSVAAGSGGAAQTVALTFQNNLAGVKMPLIVVTKISSTSGTVGATTNTTPGVGAYTHTFTAGSSNKPSLSVIFYDGVSYKTYLGASINTWDLDWTLNDAVKFSCKMIARSVTNSATKPVPVGGGITIPDLVNANYVHPVDPTQLVLTHMGGNFTLMKNGKFSAKNAREALHVINSGLSSPTDMVRATEGFIEATFDYTARYNAHTGSPYEAFLANSDPTSLVLKGTTTDTIGSGSINPYMQLAVNKPRFEDGTLDPMKAETEQQIKGRALYTSSDATTPFTVTLVNEVPRYADLT